MIGRILIARHRNGNVGETGYKPQDAYHAFVPTAVLPHLTGLKKKLASDMARRHRKQHLAKRRQAPGIESIQNWRGHHDSQKGQRPNAHSENPSATPHST